MPGNNKRPCTAISLRGWLAIHGANDLVVEEEVDIPIQLAVEGTTTVVVTHEMLRLG